MKKIILILIIVLTSLVNIAQESIESYALQVGHWNKYLEDFVYEEVKTCDVKFLLQGDVIIANDAAKSIYYTYETIHNDELAASWKAFDEERRNVVVSLYFGKELSVFTVIYDDVCYKYFLTD